MNELTPYEQVIIALQNTLSDARLQESYVPPEEIARQIVTFHPDASTIAAWINKLTTPSPSDA